MCTALLIALCHEGKFFGFAVKMYENLRPSPVYSFSGISISCKLR